MPIEMQGKMIREKIKSEVQNTNRGDKTLAIVTVGDDKASQVYVRNKTNFVVECGYNYRHISLNDKTNLRNILHLIKSLNKDDMIDGIIVQKPLPYTTSKWSEGLIDKTIDPDKDVDGLNPISNFTPCTPKGIMSMLDYYEVPIENKNVVIAGRSNLVAKPLANLLMDYKNCTVTMIHSKTDLDTVESLINNCDVFISAIGKPKYWKEHYFRDNKHKIALIDVGINRDEEGKLCGDVDPEAYKHFDFYTPVPGGVGITTVASLVDNLHNATKNRGV